MSEQVTILNDSDIDVIIALEDEGIVMSEIGVPGEQGIPGPQGPQGPQGEPGNPEDYALLSRPINSFTGEIDINKLDIIARFGDYRKLIFQHNFSIPYLCYNCFLFQDEGSGDFFFRQVDAGRCSVFILGPNGLQVYATSADLPANSVVDIPFVARIQGDEVSLKAIGGEGDIVIANADGKLSKKKLGEADRLFIAGEYNLALEDADKMIELNASDLATELTIDPALFTKKTLRIRCDDDINGASIQTTAGPIELTSGVDIPALTPLNLYKRENILLYSTGAKLIEW